MQHTFNKKRDFVYETMSSFPYSQQEILTDLSLENWSRNQAAYGQDDFVSRYEMFDNFKSEKLTHIAKFLKSQEFVQSQIKLLFDDPGFPSYWGISPETMMSITNGYSIFSWDRPGFVANMHLDNRMLVCNGMIYLIENDDPDQSTYFYTDPSQSNKIRMPTGWGMGWFAANSYDSWHAGFNNSQKDRYCIHYGIRIKDKFY